MAITGNAISDFEKLPTLRAYCKSKGKEAQLGSKIIQLVWFPNKYPSLSVDTESYRLRIPCKAGNDAELLDFFESAISSGQVLVVRITDAEKFAYEIDVLPNELGEWEEIGDHGQKCVVQERPKSKRRSKSG